MFDSLDQAQENAQRAAIEWQTTGYVYPVKDGLRTRFMISLVKKPGWIYRTFHD